MMNQEDIFKKIGQILNELNEQYQYLAQNPEELNELELELFLANSSFLSDHVQIVRKLNSRSIQKALPEHAVPEQEMIEQQPVIPVKFVDEHSNSASPADTHSIIHGIEEDIFKIDKEPSTFEFILNDKPSSDKFEFEEKSIDEIFDRPLSKEEAQIIAQKQKLRELDSLESELPEEDEIGPEPFLVSEPLKEDHNEHTDKVLAAGETYVDVKEDADVSTGTAIVTSPDDQRSSKANDGEFNAAHGLVSNPNEADSGAYTGGDTFENASEENIEEDILGETNFEQGLIEEVTNEEDFNEEDADVIPGTEAVTAFPGAEPLKEPKAAETPDFLKQEGAGHTGSPEERKTEELKPYTEPIKQSELFSPVIIDNHVPSDAMVPEQVTPSPVNAGISAPVPEFTPTSPVVAANASGAGVHDDQPKAKPTLNDILSGNSTAKNFNTGASRMPVTDLKQAISLNDKMRYIKDLFNGYNLAYAEAIDLLNKMPDFKTADAFLQNNYAVKNNWSSRQDTVDQFYELLNQRFPAK